MDALRARTAAEMRRLGGVVNLNRVIEIELNGLSTGLVAWPGNSFNRQSVHVVRHRPGQSSTTYAYAAGEEAALCVHGSGEVWLHDRWVRIGPGDVAYWPPGVRRRTRNRAGAEGELMLVSQLTPPPLHAYEPPGFFDKLTGFNEEAIDAAYEAPVSRSLVRRWEMIKRDSEPAVRPWNLTAAQVAQRGALFNVFRGTAYGGHGVGIMLVLWPGLGTRGAALNFGMLDPGAPARVHSHPLSEECLIMWDAEAADFELDGVGVTLGHHDALLAPAGVTHGGGPTRTQSRIVLGGFAAPPQFEMLLRTPHYDGSVMAPGAWCELHATGAIEQATALP